MTIEFELLTELQQTVYNVELTCQSCVDSVKQALSKVNGLTRFDIDLQNQRVSVEGITAPSTIIKAIQETGRDAIIRGTGQPNSAAVSILESFNEEDKFAPVKGLARIVSTNEGKLLVDITLNGLPKGTYYPSFRNSGDISKGASSTGGLFYEFPPIEVNEPSDLSGLYSGQNFISANLKITDLIGRSMIVSNLQNSINPSSLAGVIARSAGVWENDKQVCSCSGKTVWQERQDAQQHGVRA
ncbi:Superoxide dismutase 1 copper chaperone [Wickerhamomyces ciferrii]|uniref:Superoxide dismutase 1 copper chaperone n=1 Tax=Wickerhamomyces ciferrii (strain ATCC 14091 / BCRC 22168 / CBS 111 / JCM 3599 / NBRC 0793 / NRRL Y-1031 F-60-10) TaxID=1206466 RepID=K0KSQ0_WICCF|nr:Superoxide dismutase 1 copper chaperone [Wickerhamomyces ciferrii]CCH46186.1 Superoxide dismutase 1 copper chaperone [Wickerhamomyces ciferrii]